MTVKRIYLFLLVSFFLLNSAWGQMAADSTSNRSDLSDSDRARLTYYMGMKEYILRYANTPASCIEIVEAALSANEELQAAILPTLAGWRNLTIAQRDTMNDQLRETTRRWAVRVALEAKYPNPSIFKPNSSSDLPGSMIKIPVPPVKK